MFGGGGSSWGRGSSGSGAPPLFKATCSECGDSCEVPFRPSGDKPVYCRQCFRKDDSHDTATGGRFGGRSSAGGGRSSFDDRPSYKAVCDGCGDSCEVPFRPSGDKPVYCRQCFGKDGASVKRGGSTEIEQMRAELKAMNAKLDAVLKAVTPPPVVKEVPLVVPEEKVSKPKKTAALKAEAPKKTTKTKAVPKKKKED